MVCRVLNTDLINIERKCGFFGLCLNFSKVFKIIFCFQWKRFFYFNLPPLLLYRVQLYLCGKQQAFAHKRVVNGNK